MKRMLFNATHQEELRVAIVDGQKLIDLDIETAGREQRKGNIYKGVITRIEPGLEACFVNYGEDRHGFLPFKEVARSFFKEGVDVRSARIQDALREGQELIVQVEKEERGNKGAALTTFISLAGRYLVLMPNNPRGGGVSRRVEGEDRQELRDTMEQLDLPQGMSIIARTAGIGRNVEELQWDLSYLMQLWTAIDGAARDNSAPILIYLESSLVIRAIRDYFSPEIGEILIDTDEIADQATAFMSVVMPDNVQRVKRYRDDIPLFSRFQIEHQIETAYSRTVQLPSGGAIVIDHTEALVSVDVNSARSTRGADIEETALRTNSEAADEVARQLRLRDLGGLIVIDFIDMEDSKNQRAVEQRLRDALHFDRARVQMGKISRFGLMELSRQRLRPALNEGSHITCPRCNGTGVIRDAESSALHVLRLLQEEAMKENTAAVHAQVPVDVATYLLNEKRADITKMEARLKVNLMLIPNKHLETPHHHIERLRHDDPRLEELKTSFELVEAPATDAPWQPRESEIKARPEALVKGITPSQPAPVSTPAAPVAAPAAPAAAGGLGGLFKRLVGWLTGGSEAAKPAPTTTEDTAKRNASGRGKGRTGHDGQERRGERHGSDRNRNNRRGRGRNRREEGQSDAPMSEQESMVAALAQSVATALPDTKPASDASTEAADAAEQTADGMPMGEGAEGAADPERKRRRRRSRRGRRSQDEAGLAGSDEQLDDGSDDESADQADNAAVPAASAASVESAPAAAVEPVPAAPLAPTQVVETKVTEAQVVESKPVETVKVEAPAQVPTQAPALAQVEAPAQTQVETSAAVVISPAETPVEAAKAEPVQTAVEPVTQPVQAAPQVTQPVAVEAAAPVQAPAEQPVQAAAAVEPVVTAATPVAPAAPSDAQAIVMPATTPSAKAQALHEVVNAAGLKWVETDPDRHAQTQLRIAAAHTPTRLGRERKPVAAVSNEPLVQVETRH
ncbi:Ribonuclease E [Achromobacter spanius]|uniref:Rne/Rng family ribonuclease n=1 Tax=Achromobacter spanius TaxID=217203 RepID=UPI000C2BFFFA|nr:Rne/Rng family ribonuclease [Achromobacter spanius]AUA59580.1 ribonuclease E/G [Achromobacter spanius]CAB3654191.1 Ribonuclease E [Achromobacter spanius]VEE58187.1 Ribonuclease E [Achromobacter spanius]